jgi:hypothetical protein
MLEHLPMGSAQSDVDYGTRQVRLAQETFRFELDRVGLVSVIDVGRGSIAGYAVVGIDGRAACSNPTTEEVIRVWVEHCSAQGLEPWARF